MIYLDNAATVKQNLPSLKVMNHYASESFFNPSSLYGVSNLTKLEQAREYFLQKLGKQNLSTFVFTSGATEANNMVLNSFTDNIIISAAEHDSVFNFAKQLVNQGKNVKICPLQKNGELDYAALESLIDDKTKLVSVVHVSNETGVINNLQLISQIIKQKNSKTLFHSDGVQAFGKYFVDCLALGLDFYTISSHKIGGPKGVGGVWAKNQNKLKQLVFGGGQEHKARSGTENLPAIMAFKFTAENYKPNNQHICNLKQLFLQQLNQGIKANFENASCYILSLYCSPINAETIVNQLIEKQIYLSRGSACSSKKAGNRIFESLGFTKQETKHLLRVSFFETNTEQEVIQAAKQLNQVYLSLKQRTNLN